jgi:hypothetical protein
LKTYTTQQMFLEIKRHFFGAFFHNLQNLSSEVSD